MKAWKKEQLILPGRYSIREEEMTFKLFFSEKMLVMIMMVDEDSSYLTCADFVPNVILCFMHITTFLSHNNLGCYWVDFTD
jgi:fumarate reductase subunit C